MKKITNSIIILITIFISTELHAEWFKTTVKAMHTRSNGNVAFKTVTSIVTSPCVAKDRWEIHPADIGFKENVSLLLTAYSSKSVILIQYTGISCETWGHGIVTQIMLGDWFL